MPNTPPGLQIFSDEWFEMYGDKVAPAVMPMVKRICREWQIGDTWAPNLMGEMLAEGIVEIAEEVKKKVYKDIENQIKLSRL